MKNKKLTSLIIGILILSAAAIFTIWKTKWFKNETPAIINTDFQLEPEWTILFHFS